MGGLLQWGGVGINDSPQPFAVGKNFFIVPSFLRVADKVSLLLRQFFLKLRQSVHLRLAILQGHPGTPFISTSIVHVEKREQSQHAGKREQSQHAGTSGLPWR